MVVLLASMNIIVGIPTVLKYVVIALVEVLYHISSAVKIHHCHEPAITHKLDCWKVETHNTFEGNHHATFQGQ